MKSTPTKTLSKINLVLGWILIIGIPCFLILFNIISNERGYYMAPLITLALGVIFSPFLLTAISSIVKPELDTARWTLIIITISCLTLIPLGLPLFLDKESIYISLIGIFFTLITLLLKERIDILLLIFNGLGTGLWLFFSIVALLSK